MSDWRELAAFSLFFGLSAFSRLLGGGSWPLGVSRISLLSQEPFHVFEQRGHLFQSRSIIQGFFVQELIAKLDSKRIEVQKIPQTRHLDAAPGVQRRLHSADREGFQRLGDPCEPG